MPCIIMKKRPAVFLIIIIIIIMFCGKELKPLEIITGRDFTIHIKMILD